MTIMLTPEEKKQKIRETVAQWFYETYIKGITDRSRVKCVSWKTLPPVLKERWYKEADAKMPKLHELGVRVLAEKEPFGTLHTNDEKGEPITRNAYLVIPLIDGEVKEASNAKH